MKNLRLKIYLVVEVDLICKILLSLAIVAVMFCAGRKHGKELQNVKNWDASTPVYKLCHENLMKIPSDVRERYQIRDQYSAFVQHVPQSDRMSSGLTDNGQ